MPHEGPDILNLPAPGAAAAYFMDQFDDGQKFIRQLYGLELTERQGNQLFAKILQGPVFFFLDGRTTG